LRGGKIKIILNLKELMNGDKKQKKKEKYYEYVRLAEEEGKAPTLLIAYSGHFDAVLRHVSRKRK